MKRNNRGATIKRITNLNDYETQYRGITLQIDIKRIHGVRQPKVYEKMQKTTNQNTNTNQQW